MTTENKTEMIRVMVSPSELEKIRKAAEAVGMNLSQYMRWKALQG